MQFSSNDAKCRCQTEDLIPDTLPYEDTVFGSACSSLTDQACGDVDCIQCNWSWPKWDILEYESLDAMCRCQY